MSHSLQPNRPPHTKLPSPPLSPGICTSSCPLSQWCHETILSSVIPFSFGLQFFPASGSFPRNQFFTTGGQSIGASTSASVIPMNIQGLFLLGLTGLISLQSKGLSRLFSSTTVWKHQFSVLSLLYGPTFTSIHDYWEKTQLRLYGPLSVKWYLCFLICC